MTRLLKFWGNMRLGRKLPLSIAAPTILLTLASGFFFAWEAGQALKANRETAFTIHSVVMLLQVVLLVLLYSSQISQASLAFGLL